MNPHHPLPGRPGPQAQPGAPAWPGQPGWPGGASALASAGERLVARILDGLVLFVPNMLFYAALFVAPLLVGIATADVSSASENDVALWLLLAAAGFLVATALSGALTYWYTVSFEVKHGGQTLGKRWRKIRVIGLDGAELTKSQARKRWVAYDGASTVSAIPFLGSALGLYVLLDVLWLLWDKPYQQCLHDKYAKTIVVTAA